MTVYKYIDFQVPDWGELQQPPQSRMSYRGEVLADSPLMYLRLVESAGPTACDETGRHDATEDGTLVWGIQGPLAFDSDAAVGSTGAGGLVINETGWLPIGSSERTFELWFKPNNNTLIYRGINYGAASSGGTQSLIYTASEISVAVSECRFGIQGLSLAGQWHHAAWVLPDGATRCDEFVIYLDGQPVLASVLYGSGATQVNTADSTLKINQYVSGIANNCDFDEIAIYGGALSSQRILDHYTSGVNAGAL
jgi:Concanavalin A-like lectin/glucanases superfamily